MEGETRDENSDRPESDAEERLCSRHGWTIYPQPAPTTQPGRAVRRGTRARISGWWRSRKNRGPCEVRTEYLGHSDAPVLLAMDLDERRPHPRDRKGGPVQGVHRLHLAVFRSSIANICSTGLKVAEPRDRRDLEPLVAPRRVDLEVKAAPRGEAEVARADVDHPVGQTQVHEAGLRARKQVEMSFRCLLGRRVGEDLHFVELVNPQQTSGVAARRARFTTEARGVGHEANR